MLTICGLAVCARNRKRNAAQLFPDDLTWHFDCDSAGHTLNLVPISPSTPVKQEQAGKEAHRPAITVPEPDFPSKDHKLFKSVQVTHQRESEYEGGGTEQECQQCGNRCPKAVPEFIYFLPRCRTSRLLLSPTSSRLSNPLWQDSWPRSWGES